MYIHHFILVGTSDVLHIESALWVLSLGQEALGDGVSVGRSPGRSSFSHPPSRAGRAKSFGLVPPSQCGYTAISFCIAFSDNESPQQVTVQTKKKALV